ncbi:MAG: hypothetical protein ACRDRO_15255 [Pseudonocardiaceae bacterium]
MQHEGNQSSQSFEWFRLNDGNGEEPSSGTGRSIRPGTVVPPTVLMINLGDSLLLETWREGPWAYLSPADAVPLWRVLSAIFENTALALDAKQDNAL